MELLLSVGDGHADGGPAGHRLYHAGHRGGAGEAVNVPVRVVGPLPLGSLHPQGSHQALGQVLVHGQGGAHIPRPGVGDAHEVKGSLHPAILPAGPVEGQEHQGLPGGRVPARRGQTGWGLSPGRRLSPPPDPEPGGPPASTGPGRAGQSKPPGGRLGPPSRSRGLPGQAGGPAVSRRGRSWCPRTGTRSAPGSGPRPRLPIFMGVSFPRNPPKACSGGGIASISGYLVDYSTPTRKSQPKPPVKNHPKKPVVWGPDCPLRPHSRDKKRTLGEFPCVRSL